MSLAFDGINVEPTGDVVWLTAADTATVNMLAEPMTVWWQSFAPTVEATRLCGSSGDQ